MLIVWAYHIRIQSYILLYFDFDENDALKLSKKYVFVRFRYSLPVLSVLFYGNSSSIRFSQQN